MTLSEWLALAALVVAVAAIPTAVWATRRWGNRRARLSLQIAATPLLPAGDASGLFNVTFRDVPVADPHLLTVTFRNDGPRDISSAFFDAGRPLMLTLDGVFYGLSAVAGNAKIESAAVGTEKASVALGPSLLKMGEFWSLDAVVSGRGDVTIDSPLVDTDIVRESNRPSTELKVTLTVAGISVELPVELPRSVRL